MLLMLIQYGFVLLRYERHSHPGLLEAQGMEKQHPCKQMISVILNLDGQITNPHNLDVAL